MTDKNAFMNGVIKQEAYEEFFKAFMDAQLSGTGFLKMTRESEMVMVIKRVPPENVALKGEE